MAFTSLQIRAATLLGLLSFAVAVWLLPLLSLPQSAATGLLQVTFFDVGQGDAIFIETPDGVQVLVDGGPNAAVVAKLATVMSPWDRTLDVVLGTHPDLDHVAGLVDVLARFEVTQIITTEASGASPAAKAWAEAVLEEGAIVTNATAGQVYSLGASTTLTIFSPATDPSQLDSNTGSIVALLQYGEIGVMLTGDAPQGIEGYLTRTYGTALEAEVLKLGHHGSDTSSGSDFLQAVNPLVAIVSAGNNNRYNHPHPAVLERVAATAAIVHSTQTGDITVYSDGRSVWVE